MNKFPEVNLIVAMTEGGLIGKDGGLPWKSSLDMAWFRKQTMGHPCIFGRETAEKMGAGFPLKNRPCAVISRKGWPGAPKDTPVFSDLLDVCRHFEDHDKIFIAGGARIYSLALNSASPWMPNQPMVDTIIRTLFPDGLVDGDTYMDNDTLNLMACEFTHSNWEHYKLKQQNGLYGYASDDDDQDAAFPGFVTAKSADTLFPWIQFEILKQKGRSA